MLLSEIKRIYVIILVLLGFTTHSRSGAYVVLVLGVGQDRDLRRLLSRGRGRWSRAWAIMHIQTLVTRGLRSARYLEGAPASVRPMLMTVPLRLAPILLWLAETAKRAQYSSFAFFLYIPRAFFPPPSSL